MTLRNGPRGYTFYVIWELSNGRQFVDGPFPFRFMAEREARMRYISKNGELVMRSASYIVRVKWKLK